MPNPARLALLRRTAVRFAAFGVLAAALPAPAAQAAARSTGLDELIGDVARQRRFEQLSKWIGTHRSEEVLRGVEAIEQAGRMTADFWNLKGSALAELKRFDEAVAAFRKALDLDPNLYAAAFNLAEVRFLKKEYADAETEFLALASRTGVNSLLKFKVYLSQLLAGKTDRASATLRAIFFPIDGPAWYHAHAARLFAEGRRAEATRLADVSRAIHGVGDKTFRENLVELGYLKN